MNDERLDSKAAVEVGRGRHLDDGEAMLGEDWLQRLQMSGKAGVLGVVIWIRAIGNNVLSFGDGLNEGGVELGGVGVLGHGCIGDWVVGHDWISEDVDYDCKRDFDFV